MSTSITMNMPKKLTARRTHEATIDINIYEGDTEIRVFLNDPLALELIGLMSKALATPFDK